MKWKVTDEEGREYGIKPGEYDYLSIGTLLREHAYEHDVVQFIATLLQTPLSN